MSALVSIIVPVYNLENYIENCLNSLLNQTYDNLEIICVDDGSTDKSAEIIKSFAENDKRIVYICQHNAGVSVARNNGLSCTRGRYIMFVDGDDYMHYQAVEILYNCIVEKHCGFVFSSAMNTVDCAELMNEIQYYTVKKSNAEFLFSHIDGNQLGRSVCGKIYSRECIDGILFPDGVTHGEDFYFIASILSKKNPEFYFVNQKLYYYYHRSSSASYMNITENNLSEISVIDKISRMDFNDNFMKPFTITALINIALVYRTKAYGSDIQKCVNRLVKDVWKNNKKRFLLCKQIDIKTRIMNMCFYHSRRLYELARLVKDQTMKDFYKNRKNKRS